METKLLKAAAEGDIKTVRRILTNQSSGILGSILKKDEGGSFEMPKEKTPLAHIAVDCRDDDNNTPMVLAALNGHTEIVEMLIWHCAGLNRKDKSGNTALHFSAWHGRGDIVDLLIKHGVKVNNKNNNGDTPLHFACQYGRTLIIVKLLQNGADITEVNKNGETCLDVAARFDRKETVSILIDTDPQILKSTKSLIEAATTGRKEVVQILLNAGMNVNAVDPVTGSTALHEAARFFRKEVAQMLLDKGANVNLANNANETPMSIVSEYQQQKDNELYHLFTQAKQRVPPKPSRPGAANPPNINQAPGAPPLPSRNGRPAQPDSSLSSPPALPGNHPGAVGGAAPPPLPKKRQKRFPLLLSSERWTQNTDKYRSRAEPKNRATYCLDDDPTKYWIAGSATNNWIIFDFGSNYSISGLRVETCNVTQMYKNLDVQKGASLNGPWETVMSFTVDNKGPAEVSELGEYQDLMGFEAETQFLKLVFKNNYGAFHTVIKHIQFYGLEMRLENWLTELGMQQYFVNFLEADIAQLTRLAMLSEQELKNTVQLAGHRKKLMMALKEMKEQICILSKLKFTIPPVNHGFDLAPLPAFEVSGDPGCEDQLVIVAHGNPTIGGTAVKRLVSNGTNSSTCVFDDITLSPAGNYLIEVQSMANPQVACRQAQPIKIETKLKDNSTLNKMFDDLDNLLNFD